MNGSKEMKNGEYPQKQMGRPRRFDDEAVFLATARAVRSHGYARLTVEAVAGELGYTGPALMGRFGSKSGLLRAYLLWANEASLRRFRRAREENPSPLEALRARFRIPTEERLDEVSDSLTYINLVVFHVAAWADPQLRDMEEERRKLFESEIASLLDVAQQTGEIAGCDVHRLGKTLLAALTGTALQWASDQDRVIQDRLVEVIDELVEPYRTHRSNDELFSKPGPSRA